MKKLFIISLVIMFGVTFSDCYAKKPKKAKLTDEEIKAKIDNLRMEYNRALVEQPIPCVEESYDSMDDIRGWGFGEGQTVEFAKNKAIRNAIDNIINKMPRYIKSVTTTSADGSQSETIMEDIPIITEEQKQALNNSEIICLKSLITPSGAYEVYVVVRVLRCNLENMDNYIEPDEKLHLKTPKNEELIKLFEEDKKHNQ